MNPLAPIALLLSALTAALPASAQSACGSGGGATVCVVANGTSNAVQLQWTRTGTASGLQVFRSPDANPANRVRIAQVPESATSYTDVNVVSGKPYWYWVRFSAGTGAYNSGVASAAAGGSCAPSTVTPFVSIDGVKTASATASAFKGTTVQLAPEPASGGSWAWNGCGTTSSGRLQNLVVNNACTATAIHTNACGGKSLQPFSLSVLGVMRDLNSVQLSKLMVPGINLGNTMEAPSETAWNSVLTSQATMDGYKAAGFKSVRIPVQWPVVHADTELNIHPAWMARVKQVVDYARKAGLYVVLNNHWDTALHEPTYAHQAANNARLTKYWTQIANAFKDYDDYLLFAGMNEVGMEGQGWPTAEWLAVFNSYNQTFVNAVRATGGNNAKRHLVVQGYFTDINRTAGGMVTMPVDTVPNRLMMEVHYYDPYNFTLNGGSDMWQWGANATNPTETWANEPWVDQQFNKMKTSYVDQGYGVIIGEYGAYVKPAYPGMTEYRKDWARYVTGSIVRHGLVPMWWDTGELIDRATGAQKKPDVVSTIVNAANNP
jgi:aryl-phospho-beta-D-glucosidase BglC (GH1 family)